MSGPLKLTVKIIINHFHLVLLIGCFNMTLILYFNLFKSTNLRKPTLRRIRYNQETFYLNCLRLLYFGIEFLN
ncbi:hypothetical protein BpHYR1_009008 [Brachionus plicatilis]|uniref:Uncharacterized protein n=1 Tax=Brachionus plicatilis TaxID=10195 RepID=A0A3M7QD14_BRAPC|nr:hypothetical protein BpHYR1_009008 [Brachionus plicatilis]